LVIFEQIVHNYDVTCLGFLTATGFSGVGPDNFVHSKEVSKKGVFVSGHIPEILFEDAEQFVKFPFWNSFEHIFLILGVVKKST
jgi:hypothetical protein